MLQLLLCRFNNLGRYSYCTYSLTLQTFAFKNKTYLWIVRYFLYIKLCDINCYNCLIMTQFIIILFVAVFGFFVLTFQRHLIVFCSTGKNISYIIRSNQLISKTRIRTERLKDPWQYHLNFNQITKNKKLVIKNDLIQYYLYTVCVRSNMTGKSEFWQSCATESWRLSSPNTISCLCGRRVFVTQFYL